MATRIVTEKFCPSCRLTKPANAFFNDKSRGDGLHGHCKECFAARRGYKRKTAPPPSPDLPGEEWSPVPTFPGYEVSNMGRVRGLTCLLRPYEWKGYLKVDLRREGRSVKKRVHHLVLEAFVSPRPTGMEACHNNGHATDNRLENLRWDTATSNKADQRKHGTMYRPAKGVRRGGGFKGHGMKLTPEQVREIRAKWNPATLSTRKLAAEYGCGQSTIRRVLSRQRYHWVG